MKSLLTSLIAALIAFSATAQDSLVTISKNRFVNLDFGVGYVHSSLGNINHFLSDHGYKPLSEGSVALSFSPSFTVNRFVFRGEYTWQIPSVREQTEQITSSFGGRHVAASIGYVVLQKRGVRIFPYVGINSFASAVAVRERPTIDNADDLVNNQQQAFHLRYSNASLDFGIQIDKMIPLKNRRWDCPQNARFMTIGLRVGYIYGPEVKGRFNGRVIEGAPSFSPGGPYLKLVIGFSTKMRDMRWKK